MLRLSVRELAARADVSTDTIVRLQKGEALMPRTVAAMQQALEAAGIELLPDHAVRLRP